MRATVSNCEGLLRLTNPCEPFQSNKVTLAWAGAPAKTIRCTVGCGPTVTSTSVSVERHALVMSRAVLSDTNGVLTTLETHNLWFFEKCSRHECVSNRVHGARNQTMFKTKTTLRTTVLF